jgi:hypothetical protein
VTAAVFDAALWVGLASLFYPPAILFLAAVFAGLEVVRVFKMRERVVLLTGAFVPVFLAWLGYFLAGKGSGFRQAHWGGLFQYYGFDLVLDKVQMLKIALVALLSMFFLVGLSSLYSRKSIQTRKFVSVLYWFLLFGGLSCLLRSEWHWEHLLLPVSAMGVLLALSFQGFRSKFWAELWHLLLLAFVFVIQFSDFFFDLSFPTPWQ